MRLPIDIDYLNGDGSISDERIGSQKELEDIRFRVAIGIRPRVCNRSRRAFRKEQLCPFFVYG